MKEEELKFLLEQLDVVGYKTKRINQDIVKYEIDILTSDNGFESEVETKNVYLNTTKNIFIKDSKQIELQLSIEQIQQKIQELKKEKDLLIKQLGQ